MEVTYHFSIGLCAERRFPQPQAPVELQGFDRNGITWVDWAVADVAVLHEVNRRRDGGACALHAQPRLLRRVYVDDIDIQKDTSLFIGCRAAGT